MCQALGCLGGTAGETALHALPRIPLGFPWGVYCRRVWLLPIRGVHLSKVLGTVNVYGHGNISSLCTCFWYSLLRYKYLSPLSDDEPRITVTTVFGSSTLSGEVVEMR